MAPVKCQRTYKNDMLHYNCPEISVLKICANESEFKRKKNEGNMI